MREQVSPQEVALAAAHHLGLPQAVYPASVTRSNGIYTFLAAVLAGGLIWYSGRTDQRIWLILAGLVLLLLLGLLASTFIVRHTSMVICTQGLLRISGQQAESIRWEDMREVRQNAQGFLTVTRPDGVRFAINPTFRAWEHLAATIEQEMLRLCFPEVWEQYQRGISIRFGPVQVDQYGIGHEQDRLLWEDFGGMSRQAGMLLIEQRDGRPWTWMVQAGVPNISLLEALLEYASSETRKVNNTDNEHENRKNEPR